MASIQQLDDYREPPPRHFLPAYGQEGSFKVAKYAMKAMESAGSIGPNGFDEFGCRLLVASLKMTPQTERRFRSLVRRRWHQLRARNPMTDWPW